MNTESRKTVLLAIYNTAALKNTPVLQPVLLAEDPGRTNIGIAALSETGDLLLSAVAETRNREIVKLMDKRRQCRRT